MKTKRNVVIFTTITSIATLSLGVVCVYAMQGNIKNELDLDGLQLSLSDSGGASFGPREISLTNNSTGSTDAALRVRFVETWTEPSSVFGGIDEIFSNYKNGAHVATFDYGDDWGKFTEGDDGWFYYNDVFHPGESLDIFDGVTLTNASYNTYDYELTFMYEAIEANPVAVQEEWGRVMDI